MPDLPQTRQSLLIRLKDRSDDAWVEFLAIYEKSIVNYAQRKGLQEADALDVTQEVLAAVEAKLPSWNTDPDRGRFRGWLFRVARNIAVDKIIERSRSPNSGANEPVEQVAGVAVHHDDSDEFIKDYRRQLLHWAAERVRPTVTEKSWNAFWMSAMEGVKVETIAEQLEMTKGNVYAAKFRITARIQKLVDQFDDCDPSDWPFGKVTE